MPASIIRACSMGELVNWSRTLAVTLCLLILSVDAVSAPTGLAFQVAFSGYAAPRVRPTLVWLDERRLLFSGSPLSAEAKARYPATTETAKWANPWTFVWDTASGVVERLSDWDTLCYSSTYIRQYKRPKGDPKNGLYRIGPPRQEIEMDAEAMTKRLDKDKAEQRIYRNDFDCRSYASSDLTPPIPGGRQVALLRPGDGYLDLGARDTDRLLSERKSGGVIRWYSAKHPAGKQLPIPLAEEPGLSGYSTAKGIYIVSGDLGAPSQVPADKRWAARMPHRKYVLDPRSQTVSSVDVPNFGEGSYVDRFSPTNSGWIFTGSAIPWQQRSGIYTYDGKTVEHVEKGAANALAVSPDGCKAAYSINTEHTQMARPYRVKVVQLCK